MDVDALKAQLVEHEGTRLKPYRDSVGKLTIGVGRNLDDRGIRPSEAMTMLENDIADASLDLDRNAPWWRDMPEPAQRALADMCFNMGWPTLAQFQHMLGALKAGRYLEAAAQAMDSKWARQVGKRAEDIADQFREAA